MSVEEAVEQLMRHKGDEIVRGTKPFIRDLADSWETFKLADTTLSERYLSEIHSYAIFIKRKWGGLKPDEIKRNDIDLLLKKLKISNNTRRKYRLYIHMFFSWVVNEGHILKNPTDGISFKPDDFNGDFYTPDETSKFLRYIVEHHKDLAGYFALLIFAGLRPTEGKRVQWQDYSPKLSGLCIYP